MPQATSEGTSAPSSARDVADLYFPPLQICMRYATIFFEQVHCIYWVYSSEQFFSQLDRALGDKPAAASPSWLCSMYSVFAIASALPADDADVVDAESPSYYLSIAKNLSVQACDVADVESLRAIVLLVCLIKCGVVYTNRAQSIAFHSHMLSVSFYLTIGVAVRIALSLGLHRNVSPKSQDLVDRERCRRLWWCIYQLDQEVSVQLGHPCAIVDEAFCVQTPFASEQVRESSPTLPAG